MIASKANGNNRHLVLVNVGNTRVAMAAWSGGVRTPAEHVSADATEPIVETLERLWNDLPDDGIRAVVISSVCPLVLDRLRDACDPRGIFPLLVIGEDVEPPMAAAVAEPDKVGSDRLCVAAAAYAQCKSACTVADFGTALTVDLVSENGVFLGGTILPGITLSARALHEHTALLPLVDMDTPTDVLGKDTESAIRNGIFAMMVGALREISEQYATKIGTWPPLIVTGGDAQVIASRCDFIDRVMPDLSLDGVLLAYLKQINDEQS